MIRSIRQNDMKNPTMKLRIYGDECLRKKSDPVDGVGPSQRLLFQAMLETMYANNGIGLAAPQVGINQRFFVADIGEGPLVIVNPKILKVSGQDVMEEGCLSLPGISVDVKRARTIVVQYQDADNQTVKREFQDLLARVILHETDHLNGKLISDYANLLQRLHLRKALNTMRQHRQVVL